MNNKNNLKHNQNVNINPNIIKYIINDMLKDSCVTTSQYGPCEVITISTPNKLVEKCRMEILYKTLANKNGIPPILSANLFINGKSKLLDQKLTKELISTCSIYVVNQKTR